MKIALLNDVHIGARSDSEVFAHHQERFFSKVFFLYLEDNDIDHCYILGDLFDRRKYINFATLYKSKQFLFDPLASRCVETRIIVGNHDIYLKESNRINSPWLVLGEYVASGSFHIHTTPYVSGDHALVPWINKENNTKMMKFLNEVDVSCLLGHFEIKGMQMNMGSTCEHGMDKADFSRFDAVYSGHFHHRSTKGNITYLGSQYQMTWHDFGQQKGFHVFDTTTNDVEFVPNPTNLFHFIDWSEVDLDEFEFEDYRNMYLKVRVPAERDQYKFDRFVSQLNDVEPQELTILDESLNVSFAEDDEDETETEKTTRDEIDEALDLYETDENHKKELKKLFKQLYEEAQIDA